jgi:4-hydroxy-4-methyl-2-oxoglutarate aldolase
MADFSEKDFDTSGVTPVDRPEPTPAHEISAIRERILVAQSADVFDVMDSMGYPNQCMDLGIAPLRDDMKVAGPAFTMVGIREPLCRQDLEGNFYDNFAIFDDFYPGCVIVINAEKDNIIGQWGEMLSYGARNLGVSGIVIDGGTRDKTGILRIKNWACFARYTSPIDSPTRWRPRFREQPIYVSGTLTKYVRVNPGDWIFGDNDGVMVIPKEILMEVLVKVEDVARREELARQVFKKGWSIQKVVTTYGRA